jgi:hypothetical protein
MNRETVIPTGNRIGRGNRLGDCLAVRALGSTEPRKVRALGSVLSDSFVLWVPKGVVGTGND